MNLVDLPYLLLVLHRKFNGLPPDVIALIALHMGICWQCHSGKLIHMPQKLRISAIMSNQLVRCVNDLIQILNLSQQPDTWEVIDLGIDGFIYESLRAKHWFRNRGIGLV